MCEFPCSCPQTSPGATQERAHAYTRVCTSLPSPAVPMAGPAVPQAHTCVSATAVPPLPRVPARASALSCLPPPPHPNPSTGAPWGWPGARLPNACGRQRLFGKQPARGTASAPVPGLLASLRGAEPAPAPPHPGKLRPGTRRAPWVSHAHPHPWVCPAVTGECGPPPIRVPWCHPTCVSPPKPMRVPHHGCPWAPPAAPGAVPARGGWG